MIKESVDLGKDRYQEDKTAAIRTFDTGATRNAEDGKMDYEGFLSPIVLERYATYMHAHRKQSDGNSRPSDNWKLGIPQKQYLKSLLRHLMDVWLILSGRVDRSISKDLDDALCAVVFNSMGLLHEVLLNRGIEERISCFSSKNL